MAGQGEEGKEGTGLSESPGREVHAALRQVDSSSSGDENINGKSLYKIK